ncbi:MAG TPA: Gfo/Idh/MocA family oxidoreductase [Acidimicrobiia bacterium]|nr:Gfo/Idh/MocA family oxidoreductase [Acidimicrobiia bacterium]
MPPVNAVLVGAGSRGRQTYGDWALRHPRRLRFVAVVEPDASRRDRFGDLHGIPPGRRFGRLPDDAGDADAWVIAGPDRTHAEAALTAIGSGAAVLLEKPMAATARDCVEVVGAAADHDVLLRVSLVLRWTPFFQTVRDIVGSGDLGEVLDVAHRENVVAWHMAHSFVRGNWANAETSTPMAVQKTCHDFDIVSWVTGRSYDRLSSFGSLTHFRPDQAPPGATSRCTDGCTVEDCPFDARRLYLDERLRGWPVDVITEDLGREARLAALREGPYGRCVYAAGSDVVDHQSTVAEMQGGTTVTLSMHGHAPREERTMRYEGTRATLRGVFGRDQRIEVIDHVRGRTVDVPVPPARGGHGGGDEGLIASFVDAVVSGAGSTESTGDDVLEGHLAAFAAEAARRSGTVVEMEAFRMGVDGTSQQVPGS